MNDHDSDNQARRGTNWSRVNQWLLWLGLAAAVAWLVLRHGAHVLEIAPFLILLACPLMHLFGHGGHGGHGGHRGHGDDDGDRERDRPASADPRSTDAPPRREPPPAGHNHP